MTHVEIVGLDLSLTGTGLASRFGTTVHKPKKGKDRYADMVRLEDIARFVMEHVVAVRTDANEVVAVIENYSFNSKVAGEKLGELGGVVRYVLWSNNVQYVDVPPARLKKFTTGKGNAGKDDMLAAAIRRWGFEGSNNNEADAHQLRLMGVHHYEPYGMAVGVKRGLPAYAYEAIADVDWPEV